MNSEINNLKAEIEKLKKENKKLKLYVDATFEAVAVVDKELYCLECNEQLTKMFLYTQEEMIGKYGPDLVDFEYKELAIRNAEEKYYKPYEALMIRKDGTTFWGLIEGKELLRNGKECLIITVRNIDNQKEMQRQLTEKSEEFEAIFNNSQVGIVLLDENRIIKRVNDVFNEIISGSKYDIVLGRNIKDFHLSEESGEQFSELYRKSIEENKAFKMDYQFRDTNNNLKWINVSGRAIDSKESPDFSKGVVWVAEDISERKEMERELQKAHDELKFIFDNAGMGILLLKNDKTIYKANETFAEMHGFASAEEMSGLPIQQLHVSKDSYKQFTEAAKDAFMKKKTLEMDCKVKKKDETEFWITITGKPLNSDERKEAPNAIWVVKDITKRKENEKNLQTLARTDSLTGVFNRRYFMILLDREIKKHKRYKRPLSVLMLDIDYFKKINDNHGHFIGDKAIKHFAEVCKEEIRETDILARLGGEEFAIVLLESEIENSVKIAERIREKLIKSSIANTQIPNMTTSIGVASLKEGQSLDDLVREADELLYKGKENGRNRVEYQ